jgi:hypothetical protein
MSAFTKMMGWDKISENASMMRGQGDELMTMGKGMYDKGSGFLSGKGDWYDNAMSTFMRSQRDSQGQAGRNVMRGFASKGAEGGFAGLINANMNSAQRYGEGSAGFFSNLYQKGADMGVRLQTGAQGYTGQANQAYSKGADLDKSRSDISTGLLNSAIGLGGGLLMQNMANKGSLDIAQTMMGKDPAKAVAGTGSKPSWFTRLGNKLGMGPEKAPLYGEWGSDVNKRNKFNKQMKDQNPFNKDWGNIRLKLPSMDKASDMLPGGWKRQITDSPQWQALLNPGSPEPGAGWYGAGGNDNSYSGYRSQSPHGYGQGNPANRIGLGQNITNYLQGKGWDSGYLPPWGERRD